MNQIHPSFYEYFLGLGLPKTENEFFSSLKIAFQDGQPLRSPPHLTLHPPFLFPNGERLEGLVGRWAKHQLPFETILERVGTFQQKRYGTLFLEPKKGQPFKELVNSLNDFLIELEPVTNFHPHLTIGNRVPLASLQQKKSQLRALDLKLKWRVDAVTLYRRFPRENWKEYKSYAFSGDVSP